MTWRFHFPLRNYDFKENHMSLKDRQMSRSLVEVETEPKLPVVWLAEPRPPQHRVALGGCQPSSVIVGSKSKW